MKMMAISLPATHLKELSLELVQKTNVMHNFATSYGSIQLNYIN